MQQGWNAGEQGKGSTSSPVASSNREQQSLQQPSVSVRVESLQLLGCRWDAHRAAAVPTRKGRALEGVEGCGGAYNEQRVCKVRKEDVDLEDTRGCAEMALVTDCVGQQQDVLPDHCSNHQLQQHFLSKLRSGRSAEQPWCSTQISPESLSANMHCCQ